MMAVAQRRHVRRARAPRAGSRRGASPAARARAAASSRSTLLSSRRRGTASAPISRSTSRRHLELRLAGRVGGVDDVQQQRGLERLVERRAERGDQVVRQLLDEADRVRDQDARPGLRLQRAHGGVERREELVRDQHLAAGERAHQRRLAGVGVADQRHPQLVAPRGAAVVAVALDRRQLLASARRCGRGSCGDRARAPDSPAPGPCCRLAAARDSRSRGAT